MKKIKLSQGKVALIDDNDFKKVSAYKWSASKKNKVWYACRNFKTSDLYKRVDMHRFILNSSHGQEVDHKDGNGLNNQKSNLRTCTHSQNLMNQRPRKGGTSKYKGVFWDKVNKKWAAGLTYEYKNVWLGRHINEIDAALAYDKGAREMFGEFARCNFTPKKLAQKLTEAGYTINDI